LETALLSTPHLDAAVVMSCDHPRITAASIRRLLSMFQKAHAPIIASAYEHTVGLPALFSRTVFPDLLALPPGEDPKRIIADRAPQVDTVRMPEAATEIDTVADFETLRQ
jgi:molybdenum cofactor cytidylyltransferase